MKYAPTFKSMNTGVQLNSESNEETPLISSTEHHQDISPPPSPTYHQEEHTPLGHFRYLKGSELDDNVSYDFAIVTHRIAPKDRGVIPFISRVFSSNSDGASPRDGVQGRVVEVLVEHGLLVDIIDAGFDYIAKGGRRSKYYILLVRAPDLLVESYSRKLQLDLWLKLGNAHEMHASVFGKEFMWNPADRIQVVDHLIREGAKITADNPYVHNIFPIHDLKVNEYILKEHVLKGCTSDFIELIKVYFGEKVAFYFCFMDFYTKSLIPIAILGVLLTVMRNFLNTVIYMRILVIWGLTVSVIWSFWVIKSWQKRTKELNFQWDNTLHQKHIEYPNPDFYGENCIHPVTGEKDKKYPSYRRYPKYFCVALFMSVQILIMMLFIATWITIFEVLKVRYPQSHIFSVQWFSILLGGIAFGLFVDIFQWNCVVTPMAKILTQWENWKTQEEIEKALIRKLFVMDFLNYYTWFFLLAFVYVIPGCGDAITNMLNSALWNDSPNCCFGAYLDAAALMCMQCPGGWGSYPVRNIGQRCIPCKGWVTFDRAHLDLEQLFLTPIIVTQGLNLVLAVALPWLNKKRQTMLRSQTDKKAMQQIKAKGQRKILGDMVYRDDSALLSNMSNARYLENDDKQVEKLNAMAREVLFQSEQDNYDPYDDYHLVTVQYGFVVMFSMLWPLMPLACFVINMLKVRGDGFRLCNTLKRPFPRKSHGIGEWNRVLMILSYTGVMVYVALVFVSTGTVEFFSNTCVNIIRESLNGDLSKFHFGPCFSCWSVSERIVGMVFAEHLLFGLIWLTMSSVRDVPEWLEVEMEKKEYEFKMMLHKRRKQSRHQHHHNSNAPKKRTTSRSNPDERRRYLSRSQVASPPVGEADSGVSTKTLARAWET